MREAQRLSLERTMAGSDPEQGAAISEVYPPLNFVKAIERRQPELLEMFRCLDERLALVQQTDSSIFKLIQVDRTSEELYDLPHDALELENLITREPALAEQLDRQLSRKTAGLLKHREAKQKDEIDLTGDKQLAQRLRGLGYLD